jgi:hypothetical protein
VATETLKIVITADNKGALTSLKQTAAETDKFKMSLGDLNTRLSLLKERLNQATDPTKISKLGGEIKKVTSQIESQKSAFASLGAETEKAGGAMGSGLNKAFSGLRMIANILPGIGLAGMFGLAFEGLGMLIEKLGVFSSKVSESEKQLKDYNDVNKAANKDAGEQIGLLKTLYSAATDVNQSMEVRNKAAKELQDLFPKTYGNLSLEVIKNGEAKTSTDELTKSIIAQARAKAALAKISEIESERLDIENQKTKILNATTNEINRVKAPSRDIVFGGGTGSIGGGGGVEVTIQDQKNKILERRIAANKILDVQLDALTQRENALTKSVGVSNIVNEVAIDNAKKLKTERTYGPATVKQDIGKSFFGGGFKLGESQTVQQRLLDVEKDISKEKQKQYDLQNAIEARIRMNLPVDRKANLPMNQAMQQMGEEKGTRAATLADDQKKFSAALSETEAIMSVLGPQIDNMFAAMANGASLGEALGDMFNKLAQDIAKAAIKAAIFSIILSIVAPGSGAAAGGVSGGGGFMSMFGKMLGFAKGGISEGPQGGHMELLHGTEAILTPAQMSGLVRNSMNAGAVTSMGNNSQSQGNQTGEFMLRGNDLVLALQRSNYNLNLKRGS